MLAYKKLIVWAGRLITTLIIVGNHFVVLYIVNAKTKGTKLFSSFSKIQNYFIIEKLVIHIVSVFTHIVMIA